MFNVINLPATFCAIVFFVASCAAQTGDAPVKVSTFLVDDRTELVAAGYFILGVIFSHYLFPPKKPDYNSYSQPGDRFHSGWEGFEQTILSDGSLNFRTAFFKAGR